MSFRAPRQQNSTLFLFLVKEGRYVQVIALSRMVPWWRVFTSVLSTVPHRSLEQTLLHLFLASDTMLRPPHRLYPFLLQLFLAFRANAVFVALDALEGRVDHVHG